MLPRNQLQDPLIVQQVLKQPLTDLLLRKLKGGEKRIEVWDAKLPGFGVRVAPSGTKSFVLLYRYRGLPRRLTLGRYPVLGLGEARDLAKEALNQVARGIDPSQGKEEDPATFLFGEMAEEFVRVHCGRRNRERTRKETARILQTDFASRWKRRDVRDIGRKDVLDVLDTIVERGAPIAANNALSAIRKFFSWCFERGVIVSNPCNGIKKPAKSETRDRVLSDEELRSIWRASDTIGYPFGALRAASALDRSTAHGGCHDALARSRSLIGGMDAPGRGHQERQAPPRATIGPCARSA